MDLQATNRANKQGYRTVYDQGTSRSMPSSSGITVSKQHIEMCYQITEMKPAVTRRVLAGNADGGCD